VTPWLVLVVILVVLLTVFAVFFGDWSAGGERGLHLQRQARRIALVVGTVLIVAFFVIAWFGGFATI
jgi:membrane-anchored protein YejM (alkaline phosphatase superfamily)